MPGFSAEACHIKTAAVSHMSTDPMAIQPHFSIYLRWGLQ